MFVGEVAGVAALAVLCGIAGGAAAATMFAVRYRLRAERKSQLVDAYGRWLAARISSSRASMSFVVAFRALGAERRDSLYLTLRINEAQRARGYWCDAMRELDVAEAALIALGAGDPELTLNRQGYRAGPQALNRAINGEKTDVDRLAHELRAADQAAIRLVHSASAAGMRTPAGASLTGVATKTLRQFRTIVDRWGDAA